MFFGGKKPPKPAELVKSCRDSLTIIEKNATNPKAIEKVGIITQIVRIFWLQKTRFRSYYFETNK